MLFSVSFHKSQCPSPLPTSCLESLIWPVLVQILPCFHMKLILHFPPLNCSPNLRARTLQKWHLFGFQWSGLSGRFNGQQNRDHLIVWPCSSFAHIVKSFKFRTFSVASPYGSHTILKEKLWYTCWRGSNDTICFWMRICYWYKCPTFHHIEC